MNDLINQIGNTPMFKAENIMKEFNLSANLYLKLENKNYSGSIKDRITYYILNEAIKQNKINKDTVIIEATSGNTGISISTICKIMNLKCIIIMPKNVSIERIKMIKELGSDVILTNEKQGMQGAIKYLNIIKNKYPNHFHLNQFENKLCIECYYNTLAKEIYNSLLGQIDYFISGIGTAATVTGVSKYLKERNKSTTCIGLLPKNANPFKDKKILPHQIEGIGAGFIPNLLDLELLDEIFEVSDIEAIKYTKILKELENISCGISSGAVLYAGIIYAKKEENKNKNIVMILPDDGNRYISKGVFDDQFK